MTMQHPHQQVPVVGQWKLFAMKKKKQRKHRSRIHYGQLFHCFFKKYKKIVFTVNFSKFYFCSFWFKLFSFRLYYDAQQMEILKTKVYIIHEEDHDIHRLRFHPSKNVMMEIGFM